MRWKDISSDNLKIVYKTFNEINVELVEIMKKLGSESRYTFLHKDVVEMEEDVLRELGERTLNEPDKKKVS